MRVLITNDDGIDSPGLHALAAEAVAQGHDVVIAAPLDDYSGFGAALGPLHVTGAIDFARVELGHLGVTYAYAVDGPPALAVLAACLGAFGPAPDLVLSGINPGANLGQAVLHSGTVGAALTGLHFGISGVAASLDGGGPYEWATAAHAALAAMTCLDRSNPTVLNLNVPNVHPSEVRGVCAAALSAAGMVQAVIAEADHERVTLQMPPRDHFEPGSDASVLREGFISLTPLSGMATGHDFDALRAMVCMERRLAASVHAAAVRSMATTG